MDTPKEAVTPWEACAGGGSWQDLCLRGDSTLEQPLPEGLHPMESTHTGAICEKLQPVGRIHVGEACEGLFPVGGTLCWSRERVSHPAEDM